MTARHPTATVSVDRLMTMQTRRRATRADQSSRQGFVGKIELNRLCAITEPTDRGRRDTTVTKRIGLAVLSGIMRDNYVVPNLPVLLGSWRIIGRRIEIREHRAILEPQPDDAVLST